MRGRGCGGRTGSQARRATAVGGRAGGVPGPAAPSPPIPAAPAGRGGAGCGPTHSEAAAGEGETGAPRPPRVTCPPPPTSRQPPVRSAPWRPAGAPPPVWCRVRAVTGPPAPSIPASCPPLGVAELSGSDGREILGLANRPQPGRGTLRLLTRVPRSSCVLYHRKCFIAREGEPTYAVRQAFHPSLRRRVLGTIVTSFRGGGLFRTISAGLGQLPGDIGPRKRSAVTTGATAPRGRCNSAASNRARLFCQVP